MPWSVRMAQSRSDKLRTSVSTQNATANKNCTSAQLTCAINCNPRRMIIDRREDVTPAVLEAMSKKDGRLREIMTLLVAHLHAFAREVRLTQEEWEYGIDFLNRIGKATHDAHNEGVLFSDAIGFSTLACLLNNGNNGATETASALLGPFWRMNSPP